MAPWPMVIARVGALVATYPLLVALEGWGLLPTRFANLLGVDGAFVLGALAILLSGAALWRLLSDKPRAPWHIALGAFGVLAPLLAFALGYLYLKTRWGI